MIDETLHSFSGAFSQTADNIFTQMNKSANNSDFFNPMSMVHPLSSEIKLNECMKESNAKMIGTINSFLQFDLENQFNSIKYCNLICQSLYHLNDIVNNPYSLMEDKLISLELQSKLVDKLIACVETKLTKLS